MYTSIGMLGLASMGVSGACCALLLLTAFVSLARAADPQPYRVELSSTGIGDLDSTLKVTSQLMALRTSAPVDPFGLIARARSDVDRLRTVMESFGYYQSSVLITIDGLALDDPNLGDTLSALPQGKEATAKVSLTPGPLFHLGSITIDGTVPESARGSLGLASGAPAVANDVLAGGARLLTALQNEGYAFARVDPPIAREDPQQRVLNLTFHVVTGPHVQVGEIRFEGLKRVKERLVRRRLLLHTGQPYSALEVEHARKDLLTLGVFASVNVRLGSSPDAEGRVPITFQMEERRRHAVSLSAAYSSDLGGSTGVTWSDRNVRGNAEQLNLAANVTNLGGTASTGVGYDTSAKYIIPEFAHRDQSLQFAVGGIKQSLQAYTQKALTSGITLSRKLSSVWTASIGVSAIHETITQQGITSTYTLFALPLAILYDSTDVPSPLSDATHGVRASFSVAPTRSQGYLNTTFYITQFSIADYLDLHRLFHTDRGRSVLALRALLSSAPGATTSVETVEDSSCPAPPPGSPPAARCQVSVPDIPPDQRFYAGGSGTVRGYRYQSVGPEFPDGTPIGGTALTAINIEFRQRFGKNFGAAFFVDAGTVGEKLSPLSGLLHGGRCSASTPEESKSSCWAVGVGAGPRYYTPIGVLRLDIAVPTYRRTNDDRFEVYIGIGQAF
ncbi:MAG: BamA/TamA family outer membrane protein [Gammaproteobacteria bacterium]|nr:BamA/TamA family outer membrane protein [Gammaproteobacteria bacterium]